uniref:Ribosomal protein S11 n=1 Tax=Opuntia streptacantha TaxID=393608 RepID=A0A7C8YPH4_OPUST
MAANRKAIAGVMFSAFFAESGCRRLGQSISGFISSWKGSLAGAELSNGSFPCLLGSRRLIQTSGPEASENRMAFVRGILEQDGFGRDFSRGSQFVRNNAEEKLDVVHIKLMKNNTFITITDSNGNKKVGASSGCLEEMKGGPKLSRYAAEATAEHVGRLARNLGLKSVVMRVNGFTHFKKKKQAILSWREGYTYGRGDKNPIAYIEDTTRRPHNGCRLPKRRRV